MTCQHTTHKQIHQLVTQHITNHLTCFCNLTLRSIIGLCQRTAHELHNVSFLNCLKDIRWLWNLAYGFLPWYPSPMSHMGPLWMLIRVLLGPLWPLDTCMKEAANISSGCTTVARCIQFIIEHYDCTVHYWSMPPCECIYYDKVS